MRSLGVVCALGALGALGAAAPAGCAPPPPRITWVQLGPRCPSRPPEAVSLFFTWQAVPSPHAVVARYQVHVTGGDLERAVAALRRRAAADGSDAVLLERGDGAAVTVWSWLLLFIPLQERVHVLYASGLRLARAGGPSCPRA